MAFPNAAGMIDVDTREFDRALKEYLLVTSRELSDALNTKALFIARGALAETPRAQRGAIEKLGLRTVSVRIRTTSSGKVRQVRKFALTEGDAIRNYLAARKRSGRAVSGRSFSDREALAKAARKWIAAKLRAIGFLASGWVPAIRKLTPLVGEAYQRPANVVSRPSNLGQCTPAKPGFNPFVEIENSSTLGVKTKDLALAQRGHSLAIAALQRALAVETASMADYIAQKMQRAANKFIPPKTSTK